MVRGKRETFYCVQNPKAFIAMDGQEELQQTVDLPAILLGNTVLEPLGN